MLDKGNSERNEKATNSKRVGGHDFAQVTLLGGHLSDLVVNFSDDEVR